MYMYIVPSNDPTGDCEMGHAQNSTHISVGRISILATKPLYCLMKQYYFT